jgi:eukaryotic-like serine/threonine-protein kinase
VPYETTKLRGTLNGTLVPEIDRSPDSGVVQIARKRRAICAGDLIENRYRVLNAAATGGMASVYICDDTLLGRRVAVKFVRSDANADGRLKERLFGEARITAQLESPHVARLYDYGVSSAGEPFMIVEFVDGPDLFTVLQTEGPCSADEVVSYALQICEGLREAHRKGIVHYDLKPENLVVGRTPEGTPVVKIIDFGISKWHADLRVVALTRATVLSGSPNYMSPEQIETPAAADPRTDIWSLGVVMCELLTGVLPFQGEDERQTCASVLSGPSPSVMSLLAGVSPELEKIILRCLKRDRNERFADVDELTLALSEVVLRRFGRAEPAPAVFEVPLPVEEASLDVPRYAKTSHWGRRLLFTLVVTAGVLLGVRSDQVDAGPHSPVTHPADPGAGVSDAFSI